MVRYCSCPTTNPRRHRCPVMSLQPALARGKQKTSRSRQKSPNAVPVSPSSCSIRFNVITRYYCSVCLPFITWGPVRNTSTQLHFSERTTTSENDDGWLQQNVSAAQIALRRTQVPKLTDAVMWFQTNEHWCIVTGHKLDRVERHYGV